MSRAARDGDQMVTLALPKAQVRHLVDLLIAAAPETAALTSQERRDLSQTLLLQLCNPTELARRAPCDR